MSKKKKKNIFGKIIILLLIIGLIVGVISGKYWYENYKVANIEFEAGSVKLFIPKGSSQQDVLAQIIELDIVSDIISLAWLAEQKNYKGNLVVSGNYVIKSGWTNNQLINHLRAGNGRIDANVSFTNVDGGWRKDDNAAIRYDFIGNVIWTDKNGPSFYDGSPEVSIASNATYYVNCAIRAGTWAP